MKQLKKLVARAVRKSSGSNGSARRQGDAARDRGDWNSAATSYRRHVRRNPQDFNIWVQLGHALKESGRYDEAEAAYQQAHQLNSANADLFLSRGHLAKLRRDMRSAINFYNHSFLVDGNPDAARELGAKAISAIAAPSSPPLLQIAGALEKFEDGHLIGWVVNPDDAGRPAEVEILLDGEVIGTTLGVTDRPELRKAHVAANARGFHIDLRGKLDLSVAPQLFARVSGTEEMLAGSPLTARMSATALRWLARNADLSTTDLKDLKERIRFEAANTHLSLIVATDNADLTDLDRIISSLMAQWSDDWELLLLHSTASSASRTRDLKRRVAKEPRIRVVAALDEKHSAQMAVGVAAANGDYVLPIRASTVLEPEAIFRILDAAQGKPGLIYWDDAITGLEPGSIERFITRPGFSHDHLLASPELLGAVAVRRDIAENVNLEDATDGNAADLDFLLHCIETGQEITHIPAVLSRIRKPSVQNQQPSQSAAIHQVIKNHLQRSGSSSKISQEIQPGIWDIAPPPQNGRRLIVIFVSNDLSRLKQCVESVLKTTLRAHDDIVVIHSADIDSPCTDYLNAMDGHILIENAPNERALATQANAFIAGTGDRYDHVALLDDNLQPRSDGWLDLLCALADRQDVGVASPVLADRTGHVQAAGCTLGHTGIQRRSHGIALYSGKLRNRGWNDTLLARHNVSAAGDCIVLRRQLFIDVNGLDSSIPRSLDKIDLCLRLGQTGFQILVEPQVVMRSAVLPRQLMPEGPFRVRWAAHLSKPDMHDNPLRASEGSESRFNTHEAWSPRARPSASAPAEPELARRRLIPETNRNEPMRTAS